MTDPRESYSFSKIQLHSRCSQMYKLHYVERMYRYEDSDATFTGSMVHEALESYYKGEANHPSEALQKAWSKYFQEKGLEDLLDRLNDLKEDINYLQWRASAACTDPALMIRNQNGAVPKSTALNRKYQQEEEKLSIQARRGFIDKHAFERVPNLSVSLVQCYSDSTQLMQNYEEIPGLTEVLHVELPLSERSKDTGEVSNPVVLPRTGAYLNGYADLVAVVNDQVAIIDHKTSSGDGPDVLTVMYWDQLLLYAYGYEQVFGVRPYYIGINHIRSGRTILAPINWSIVEDAVARFEAQIEAAKSGMACKRSPTEYNSPCLGGAKNLLEATRPCRYLDVCHPDLHEVLKG